MQPERGLSQTAISSLSQASSPTDGEAGGGLVSWTWLKADIESVFHGHQKPRWTQVTDYFYCSIQYVVIWVVTKKSLWGITFWCATAMQESNRPQRCHQALEHDWNSVLCYPNKLPIQELTELSGLYPGAEEPSILLGRKWYSHYQFLQVNASCWPFSGTKPRWRQHL